MRTTRDGTTGVVRVAVLDILAVHHRARENALPEAGRESFELRFDTVGHVDGRAVRHMAVRPQRLLACGRARGIEEALLRHQNERPLRMLAAPHGGLRS